MLKKLYYWFKIMVWEQNRGKIAEELCKIVDKAEFNKGIVLDINEKYGIGLNAEQIGKLFDNFKDIVKTIIKRQI